MMMCVYIVNAVKYQISKITYIFHTNIFWNCIPSSVYVCMYVCMYVTYQKPDKIIQYIHVESNHPPNIIKQLPQKIKKCLSQLSSNKDILNKSAPFYEDKLHRSGYQQKLRYNPVNTKTHNNLVQPPFQ